MREYRLARAEHWITPESYVLLFSKFRFSEAAGFKLQVSHDRGVYVGIVAG